MTKRLDPRSQLTAVRRAAAKAVAASEARDAAIRAARNAGATHRAIAREAGVSYQRVHQILHGR